MEVLRSYGFPSRPSSFLWLLLSWRGSSGVFTTWTASQTSWNSEHHNHGGGTLVRESSGMGKDLCVGTWWWLVTIHLNGVFWPREVSPGLFYIAHTDSIATFTTTTLRKNVIGRTLYTYWDCIYFMNGHRSANLLQLNLIKNILTLTVGLKTRMWPWFKWEVVVYLMLQFGI